MTVRCLTALLIAALFIIPSASAQTDPAEAEHATIETTIERRVVDDLPSSANVYSILETMQSDVIADRFYTGGLNTGQPSRLGGFLSSPGQTLFRIDDVNVTDPDGSGTPLLFPDLMMWERITSAPGLMPSDVNAPGLSISLVPRRPSDRWTSALDASGAPPAWVTQPSPGPPPVEQLDHWIHGSAVVSGPVIADRLGIVAGASWTRGAQFRRGGTSSLDGDAGSLFAHAVYKRNSTDEVRALGWVQRATYPFADRAPATRARDLSVHAQSTFERRPTEGISWRLFGAVTERDRALDVTLPSAGLVIERLVDGPVPELVESGGGVNRRLSGGIRLFSGTTTSSRQRIEAGLDVERSSSRTQPAFKGRIGELVDGTPARIWQYVGLGIDSQRHETGAAIFASDVVSLSRAVVDFGIRLDAVKGAADGAETDVSWGTVLPHANMRWRLTNRMGVAVFAGYARSAYRLPLAMLAYGDPAAPVADIFRWDAAAGPAPSLDSLGPAIARIGPGTGGDPTLSAIDPGLKRPTSDEIVIGAEARPGSSFVVRAAGIARWEHDLMAVVDTTVPLTSYSTQLVAHSGTGPANPSGTVLVYNRLPSSFERDQYVLTNPSLETPRSLAVDISIQAKTEHLYVLLGGTAQLSEAPAAYRGYHALENDQGIAGELLTNPNAFSNGEHGRPFIDRAYTGKLTVVYRLPMDVRVGAIARYQDGQPFAPIVVVPGLNQGAEPVRAYENGYARFTFTGTLDLRVQKGVHIDGRRVDAILDVFNLTKMANEVEERVVVGPGFRTVTAIQPPRAIHIGARLTF